MFDDSINVRTTGGFAVLDLETTGLQPRHGARIVEIGVVTVDSAGTIESTWETLVDPGQGPGPTHIHGVSADMLIGAPSFAEIAGNLAEVLAGRVLVAHNARFDVGFLDAEFRLAGLRWSCEPLCTLKVSKLRAVPLSLAAACEHFGIVNHGAHRALGDAHATAELLACLEVLESELPTAVKFPDGWPLPVLPSYLRMRSSQPASTLF